MVNQQVENQSQQGLAQDDSNSLDDYTPVDNTSSDQLELEAELDNEAAQPEAAQVAEVDGEEIPLGADTERQASPESQEQAPPEPASRQQEPEQQPETPPQRTYSVEEVARIQAAKDREIAQERAERQRLAEEQARLQLDRNVEAVLADQEANLATTLGAEEARRLARSSQNVAAVRQGQEAIQQADQLRRQNQEILQTQEDQARQIVARTLMDQHGLQSADYELLLSTSTPVAMQTLARRLANQTIQERQQEQQRKSRVPAETPQTQLENGSSTGAAPETPEQRLNRLRGLPSYEWSDADYKFMRDGV